MTGSFLACLLVAAVTPRPSAKERAVPADLRCEHRTDPLGIEEPAPRLSWIIEVPARDWRQSAYRIAVASSPARLAKPDLWDSGKVGSVETTLIPYRGRALRSNQVCFWRVQVWDGNGARSIWSKPARWQMGLLDEAAWHGAQWIGGVQDESPAPAPLLRHEFRVSGPKVERATLYACGLGYAELHLNGKKVGSDERDPGYTNFDKRVLYVAYDVTKQIRPGANRVGAILGTGWYDVHDRATWNFDRAPWRGRPRLRLLLLIEFADGSVQTVTSGAGWQTADSPILFDGIYTGEVYDARHELPGWDQPGPQAENAKFFAARVMPAPKGKLVALSCPGVGITRSFAPKAITEPKPGVYVVDFGQNLAGHVRLRVKAPAGTRITMRYSERIDKEGMIERSQIDTFMAKSDPPQPFQTDVYICKGGGEETWEQIFSYSGFRYAEVTGFPGRPAKANFEARFAHTDFESAGGFECSNDLLNRIQQATRYAYLSNAQSIPTDCPQREKNGWTGDAQLAAETGLMNFRSTSFYEKWLDDFADDQAPDGKVSVIVPTGGWGSGNFNPAWDSAYPIVAWDLYRYCGNVPGLPDLGVQDPRHYDHLKRYVDALAATTEEGVIPFESLGDWVPWKTETSSKLTSTVYLYVDATIVERFARLLGNSEDAAKYEDLARRTKDAFNRHFYDPAAKTYGSGSQTALSMALYFDLVPNERRAQTFAQLVANVEGQGHIDAGILGAKYVLRVLSESGRTDLAYKLVARKEQPGWGWWIEQGATTLWEDWRGESSLNHIMFGDVSNWMIQWLAGIGLDPDSPGFRHILIHPEPVGDLTWAKAWHDSPHGRISSEWSVAANVMTLKLTIPANCTATVMLPGKPLDGAGNRFEIGSGTYEFRTALRP